MHEIHFFRAEGRNVKVTAQTGESLLRHGAARQLEKETPHEVKCSPKPTDASQRFDVFHYEEDLRTVLRLSHDGLQKRSSRRVLISNSRNGKLRKPPRMSNPVYQNFVLEKSLECRPKLCFLSAYCDV